MWFKVWQLASPNLQDYCFHDVLLVDECEDMSAAVLEAFRVQKTPKIFAGDPRQRMNPLAEGSFETLSCNVKKCFRLTKVMRFGPQIGFVADCLIRMAFGDQEISVVTRRKKDELLNADEMSTHKPVAILARTERRLFWEIIRLMSHSEDGKVHQRLGAFAGGMAAYRLQDYRDILALQQGRREQMKRWTNFASLQEFEAAAERDRNEEILEKIGVVKDHGEKLAEYLDRIERFCKTKKGDWTMDFVFGVARKAKGLQWDSVILLDDFLLHGDVGE